MSLVSQDLHFRKPLWAFVSMLWVSRCLIMKLVAMCSSEIQICSSLIY